MVGFVAAIRAPGATSGRVPVWPYGVVRAHEGSTMLRALVAAALLTTAAIRVLGIDTDVALGYSAAICLGLWLAWPLARRIGPFVRRHTRRRRRTDRAALPSSVTPTVAEIHYHYHHDGPVTSPSAVPVVDPALRGLPQRTRRQIAHDAIYDTIDTDHDA